MSRVDKAELDDKFKRDLLNKMLQSVNLRIDRLYGIEKGNNQFSLPNSSVSSQSDLAAQMDISVDTLQNYKMLADMIAQNREKFMFPILETHD